MKDTTVPVFDDDLSKVKVKTLEEIKREKLLQHPVDNSAKPSSSARVRLKNGAWHVNQEKKKSEVTHGESSMNYTGVTQGSLRSEQNYGTGNGSCLSRDLANSSGSTSDWINSMCGELLDEELEPHGNLPPNTAVTKHTRPNRPCKQGNRNTRLQTQGKDFKSRVEQYGENNQEEIVSLHPGTTEFYEENDNNWDSSVADKMNNNRLYPKLQVKTKRQPVIQRVVINKEQFLDSTVQQKTKGLHSNSYVASPKKQTLEDIKMSRTHEWCSLLNDNNGSSPIQQNGLFSGQSSSHQLTENGISLSSGSETLTQPSLLSNAFNPPKPNCGSHEGKPSSTQTTKFLQTFNSEMEDVKSASLSRLKETQSTNVFSRLGPPTTEGLIQYPITKRKNIGNNHEHGGKMRVSSLPNEVLDSDPLNIEIFWRSDLPPKGFCFIQLQHGSCGRNGCKFKHISMKDVEEYQKIKKMREKSGVFGVSSGSSTTLSEMDHSGASAFVLKSEEQNLQSSSELIKQYLENNNLVEALNLIEKLDKAKARPSVAVLETVLCRCSQDKANSDTSAQVAARAFKLIKKIRGKHNRHDFTTLIECLCNAGQYIMAYEKLGAMKDNGFSPTLDVFLNLIKSSHADPHWAFDLLEEVKCLDLLKAEICNDLILLGIQSKPPLTSKVMALYQDTLSRSIKLSQKTYNVLLKVLCETASWPDLCLVLCNYEGDLLQLPNDAVVGVMENAWNVPDWIEGIVKLISDLAEKRTINIQPKPWNNLLAATFEAKSAVDDISQVVRVMDVFKVPFHPQLYDPLITALSQADRSWEALKVFDNMMRNPEALNQPGIQESLNALCQALIRSGNILRLQEVHQFINQTKRNNLFLVDENPLIEIVDGLVEKKDFASIQQLLSRYEQRNHKLTAVEYRKFISALEQWKENPEASVMAYRSFRKAYPVLEDDSESDSSSGVRLRQQPHKPCKYYSSPNGCNKGSRCTFLHALSQQQSTKSTVAVFAGGFHAPR